MSQDLNRVFLVGRLVRDIELTYTQSGTALGKLDVAVNRRVKKDGEWIDDSSFFNCVFWGKRSEALAPYLLKGQQVAIDGRLRQDRWEKEGAKRSKVVIELDNVQLLGSSKGDKQEHKMYEPAIVQDKLKDDIPF